MNQSLPAAHPDPTVEATRPYITSVVLSLIAWGIPVHRSWLDPRGPRDATIQVLGECHRTGASEGRAGLRRRDEPASSTLSALVWDEETGWRWGRFVSGRPGERTVLASARALGGGLLPPGDEVAERLRSGVHADPQVFRRWFDRADGFDESLVRAGEGVLLPV